VIAVTGKASGTTRPEQIENDPLKPILTNFLTTATTHVYILMDWVSPPNAFAPVDLTGTLKRLRGFAGWATLVARPNCPKT
jgi:hypothetical protein